MRVIIYKQNQGVRNLTVLPRRRALLAPVSLRGLARDVLRAQITPLLVLVADREHARDPQGSGT